MHTAIEWLHFDALTSGLRKRIRPQLAISGQALKDLYNEHAPSDVKGMLNWQNVNKFIFCTPQKTNIPPGKTPSTLDINVFVWVDVV